MQQGSQPEAGGERERRVGFVHQVEARLVHPGAQDLQEALAVAELVEVLRLPPRVVLQVGVQAVHGVGAQEVGPARPDRAALHDQARASRWLAGPDPEQLGLRRAALRIEAARLGQHLHQGGLPGAILPDQHGQPGRQVQALAQQLFHRRDGGRPPGGVDRAGRVGPDPADHPAVGRPARGFAAGHLTTVPRPAGPQAA
jgi:hypothetical protein